MDTGREGEDVYETKLTVDTWGVPEQPRVAMPDIPVAERRGNFKEVETGLSPSEAVVEANRCLQCDCKICINLLGCPSLLVEDGKAAVEESSCPGCGVCAQVCPHDAIKAGGE